MANGSLLVTYLRLTPEFGGTRFGPFDGVEVRLGSNPEQCHIVLPESLGVFREHVKLVRQSAQNLILAPVERTATVFLYRSGTHGAQQIMTPTAVRPGDAFALVTADGPRFVIEADAPPEDAEVAPDFVAGPGGRKIKNPLAGTRIGRRLTPEALAAEGKRQVWTRILVYGPLQMAQRAWIFVKSGAVYQPRYIFLYATVLGGWIFGGFAMCGTQRATSKYETTVVRTRTCESELNICQNMSGDATENTFEELVGGITGLGEPLVNTLQEDDILRKEVERKTAVHLTDTAQWKWLVKPRTRKANDFASWRARVQQAAEDGAIDNNTARLLTWAAAQPGDIESDFIDVDDSESQEVCGRGPLAITYRHALSLGLQVQPDALIGENLSDVETDRAKREELLRQTVTAALGPPLPETIETQLDPIRQGRSFCLYATGDDDRTDPAALMKMMKALLGKEASLVPADNVSFGSAARLAKFFAGDLLRVDYNQKDAGIDFTSAPVGMVLEGYEQRGAWVLSRTADTIAKAAAIPCLMALQGEAEDAKKILGDTNVPSPIQCLVLDWKLRNQE